MNTFGFNIRALDLTMGWAGPLVTQMLAEMGAEVIKVEDIVRFDWWRGSLSMAPPEMQPIERSPTFNTTNRGKLGITLNLADPRGVAILKKLAAVSDVLVDSFSPDVMKRLGLEYGELARINPRLIMLSMPAFGREGPDAGYRGYGLTVEAMAGITSLNRYHDAEQPYSISNALGDPVSGLSGMLALLAALRERERTGAGQFIEVAQVETTIPFVAEAMIEHQLSGALPTPIGNRHARFAPHGIFRCAGDAWIALGIEREEQWPRLLHALGIEHLARDTRFTSMESRKRNEDALEREIRAATIRASADELAERLQSAGIAAGPVNSAASVLADDQLHSREFWVPIERKIAGTYLYPGAVARLSATPLNPGVPAPTLGEHNRDVLARLAGLSDRELDDLERAGVIGSSPRES